MKTAGIICEFNPFHDGHKYLIQSVRRDLSPDAVICIMSGNFVQRGEASMWNKWDRAKSAVEGSADLVLQMPVCVSLSSAQYFAKGAVDIASALGIDYLCFGSESGDIDYLRYLASEGIKDIEEGNNILGCEYLRNMPEFMSPYTIKIDETLGHASSIRNNYVNTLQNKAFDLLRYKILTSGPDELKKAPEVSAGLENRIFSKLSMAESYDEFVLSVKSKRYNYAKISRSMMQILLGIERSVPESIYAHVLAFNETGRSFLALQRDNDRIKLYTGISPEDSEHNPDLKTDVKADDIYSLMSQKSIYEFSDYVCKPFKSNI